MITSCKESIYAELGRICEDYFNRDFSNLFNKFEHFEKLVNDEIKAKESTRTWYGEWDRRCAEETHPLPIELNALDNRFRKYMDKAFLNLGRDYLGFGLSFVKSMKEIYIRLHSLQLSDEFSQGKHRYKPEMRDEFYKLYGIERGL